MGIEKLRKLEKAATKAARVRGRHYNEWWPEIASLKRSGKHGEALGLLAECMDAAEGEARIAGHEYLPFDLYEHSAIIHRKEKDYGSELAVLERYLTKAPQSIGSRSHIETRYRKAWKLRYGAEEPVMPKSVVDVERQGETIQSVYEDLRSRAYMKAKKHADKFRSKPVLKDDEAESRRRSRAGIPSELLKRAKWRKQAVKLAGRYPDTEAVIDALLSRADRWGVVEPDHAVVNRTFELVGEHSSALVDLRTGEVYQPRFVVTATELWVAAVTGLSLGAVERTISRLQADGHEVIAFWEIPGDFMEGKAELHLK